jgi:hypothetical protein
MTQVLGYLVLATMAVWLVVAMYRPYQVFPLVILMYPVKQLMGSYLPLFLRVSPLFNVIVFAIVAAAVLSRLKRGRAFAGLGNPFTYVTLLLYGYATFAILWSPGNGVDRWLDGYAYWIMQVCMMPLVVGTLEELRRTIVPLLIAGSITAVLFFTNPQSTWYSGRLTIYMGGRGTKMEARGNALTVGQMGGQLAIAAAMMLPVRAGLLAAPLRITAIILGLGLSATGGARAQSVLAVLTIVLFYPVSRRVKSLNQFFLAAGGLVTLAAVMYAGFALFLNQSSAQAARWDLASWWDIVAGRAEEAMVIVRAYGARPQNWLQGLGTNAFSYYSTAGVSMNYAHNAPVEMLCELGLIGLALYVLGCVLAFRAGRQLFRLHSEDPLARSTVAVLLALCFYAYALSNKQYTFVAVPEPWWFWMIMVKLASAERSMATASGTIGGDEQGFSDDAWDADPEWDQGEPAAV